MITSVGSWIIVSLCVCSENEELHISEQIKMLSTQQFPLEPSNRQFPVLKKKKGATKQKNLQIWILLKMKLMDRFLPAKLNPKPTLMRAPAVSPMSSFCVLSPVLLRRLHVVFPVRLSGPLTSPSERTRSSIWSWLRISLASSTTATETCSLNPPPCSVRTHSGTHKHTRF